MAMATSLSIKEIEEYGLILKDSVPASPASHGITRGGGEDNNNTLLLILWKLLVPHNDRPILL